MEDNIVIVREDITIEMHDANDELIAVLKCGDKAQVLEVQENRIKLTFPGIDGYPVQWMSCEQFIQVFE
jgi:hypothetical protein